MTAGFDGRAVEPIGFFLRSFRRKPRRANHKLIATHTGNVVVSSANILQAGGEFA